MHPSSWSALELRHLLALCAIADEGSFQQAATRLGYTQSGVSQQIQAMERIVGERMLDRPGGSRPVGLTPAGEVMLRHARAILAQANVAQADLERARAGGGSLRVGAFQSVGARLLPSVLARLESALPVLEVELTHTIADAELFDLLLAGQLDVAFVMLPALDGPFDVHEIFADPFVALVPADSPTARRAQLSLRDLCELPLVTAQTCRSSGDPLTQARERGLEPQIVQRSDDNGTVLGLVSAGRAAAVVPQLAADRTSELVAVVPLEESVPPRRVALCWQAGRERSAKVEAFLAAVEDACGELGFSQATTIST